MDEIQVAGVEGARGSLPVGVRTGALVSSVEVIDGTHDRVRVWNRGGLAGELVVASGDGVHVRERLMQWPALRALRAVGATVDELAHDLEEWRENLLDGRDVRLEGVDVQRLEDLISQVCDASCRLFEEARLIESGAP